MFNERNKDEGANSLIYRHVRGLEPVGTRSVGGGGAHFTPELNEFNGLLNLLHPNRP